MQSIVNSFRPKSQRSRWLWTTTALVLLTGLTASCSRTGAAPAATKVTVIGEASLKTQPDAAVITLSVVTLNAQALNAQQENANKSDAVSRAVQDAAGKNAEIKTNAYNLQPQQSYGQSKLPKIVGYEARNSITVTTTELNKVGALIDAASRAGANSVEGVSFILRDTSGSNGQALAEATRQAMTKARSIAQAMGGRVLRVVEEQEQATTGPQTEYDRNAITFADSTVSTRQTPVRAGPLTINSRVQLIVEVEAKP